MGWSLRVVVTVLVLVSPSSSTICDYSQCKCTNLAKWITAVCVFNSSQRTLDITPDSLPRNLAELEMSGPREIVLYNGSFSRNLTGLNLVRLSDIGKLTVEKKAFARLANPHLILEVVGASLVILESSAFHELKGVTVSAKLERVDRLIVQEGAFDRFLDLEVRQVKQLELQQSAFFFETKSSESQGPATKITLDGVKMKELPYNVFPALNHLTISNSEVGTVRSAAFRALTFIRVSLDNTTIALVETEAFTTRSAIATLELEGVTVGRLQPNSFQSGISHVIVRGSSISEVSESAFHTSIASVSLSENVFNHVRSRGFTFKQTSMLNVENNRFNILEDSAFNLFESDFIDLMINTTFRGNSLGREIGKGALDFTRKQSGTNVYNNSFDHLCDCEGVTKNWLKEKINGTDNVVDLFYDTSLCQINFDLSRCFSIPYKLFNMENFTTVACDADGKYYCSPEVVQSDAAIPSFPGMTSDIVYENSIDRERKVLGSIFIFVISGVVLMLFFSAFMWLRQNGYCTKARLLLLPSAESMLNIITRMFTRPASTTSSAAANRTTAHEYAELQQIQKQIEESGEDDISLEDKATQTLPEELTQELLQTLREKLDDPDNYSEARDMIEHLYDLIKVEESCNQNSEFTSIQLYDLGDLREGENVYDVIQPKIKSKSRANKEKKSLISIGTRAPSPDKLLPLSLSRLKPAVVCDYVEPRDRQMHIYQELPGINPSASILCDYMEPPDTKPHVYHELSSVMINRPLPSKPDPRLSDPGEGPSSR